MPSQITATHFSPPPRPPKKPKSFLTQFAAGAIAGGGSTALVYPIDRLANIQSQSGQPVFNILKESTIRSIYVGLPESVLANTLKRGAKLGFVSHFKAYLVNTESPIATQTAAAAVAGAGAGVVNILVCYPAEYNSIAKSTESLHRFFNAGTYTPSTATKQAFPAHGVYQAGFNATTFGTAHLIEHLARENAPDFCKDHPNFLKFTSGAGGAITAVFITHPLYLMRNAKTVNPSITITDVPISFRAMGPRAVRFGLNFGLMMMGFEKVSEWLSPKE